MRSAARLLSPHSTAAPPEEPPEGSLGFLLGAQAGGWGAPGEKTELAQIVRYVRLSAETEEFKVSGPSLWTSHGLGYIYDAVGITASGTKEPLYSGSGVKAINRAKWAEEAVAFYEAHPDAIAIEVLNEPGGQWFWGAEAESTANRKAYAELCKAVHEAFVAYAAGHGGKRPLLLGSWDGGHGGSSAWGNGVKGQDAAWLTYLDGITCHPYKKEGGKAAGKEGARAGVEAAYATAKLPVWITEIGWPTELETGDSYKYDEEEQAANIKSFVEWARSKSYVQAVFYFKFREGSPGYSVVSAGGTKKAGFGTLKALSGL